ncbi:class I SAM-dependent methyltransferase [Gloeobacter violaceus]|uniref:Gll2384 protein n=1 Tax=Gloeobacter violaceus (strain ATCC 29082 / PCC 7421) TaxID=251221 RepID=Q7NI00_GLOVI|nr:SAM-dependent methyltransferase [Gloeobacter violaceus]BAC90325.1 gll2384 [Gloeobacter violaceus PCC 7421]
METPPVDDSNPALRTLIAQRVAASPGGRLNFAQFMDLALYHPELGYYATHPGRIGGWGDYITAAHLGSDFGELLAVQAAQLWRHLGKPEGFDFVEMGAGQGLFAADFLRHAHANLPDFAAALDYRIVERSAAQLAEQRRVLAGLPVRWCDLEQIAPDSVAGCFFANELVDALPVHQFVVHRGELLEIYVALEGERDFVEVAAAPSTPRLAAFLDRCGIATAPLGEGYRSEVNLAALDWLEAVARRLARGYVLTVDYGYTARQYYAPQHRSGTLACYHRHRVHDNPYLHIGNQDITAHVNFTALQTHGAAYALRSLGFTRQSFFLLALGLGERLAALGAPGAIENNAQLNAALRRREALRTLVDPGSMGDFGVLIQGKNTDPDLPLAGLSLPAQTLS